MEAITHTQELARRFNEAEAVWRRYEDRRKLRLLGLGFLVPDEVLDEIDWIEAERESRVTWCVARVAAR